MNKLNKKIECNSFAEACYDQNSIEELIEGLLNPADKIDMKGWGIRTAREYKGQIATALYHKIKDKDETRVLIIGDTKDE